MKRIIPLICLLLAGYLPIRAQIGGEVELNVNELYFSQQNGYDVIHWNGGADMIRQVGAPELPVILKTYVIPLEAQLTGVEVSVSNRVSVDGIFIPYPAQQPIPINTETDGAEFTQPDTSIYQGTEIFPHVKAQIVADYNEMGYHLVTVQLHPVEYDPTSRQLFVSHLNFSLQYDMAGSNGIQPQKQSVRRANAIKRVIRSMVDNPEDVDGFTDSKVKLVGGRMPDVQTRIASSFMSIDVIQEQVPDYIIITNNELKSEFQRLADWKTQKGVPTLIKDVESIGQEYQGADLAEKIHAYLQECYRKWGAGLFVLLGGDTNIITERLYWSTYDAPYGFYPSDAYYVDLNSSWNANKNHLYRETGDGMKKDRLCYLGRASVENVEEAKNFINKVLLYEKMENVDANYLMNHLAVSAYISKDESKDSLYNDGKESINDYLSQYPQINKWYLFDHYNCTCSLHGDKTMYHSGQELNKAHFLSALQDGGDSGLGHFHIVYHMDHSHPRALGASSKDKHESIYIQDVDNLNNGDQPLIMISGGCKPAKFTEDCIAEHFLTNPKGGAVAFIGNEDVGWSDEHDQYKAFLQSLYKDGIQPLGMIFGTMFFGGSEYYRLHLLGDPEMPVWSAVPQELEVNVPPTQIEAGANTITVQITNLPAGEEATVCLMKDAEAYTVVTVNDTKPHSFTFTPKTSGEMTVTVTARNFIPFEKTVPVSVNSGNLLSIDRINNFEGYVLAGMGPDFDIVLKNNGKTPARNVKATLTSPSPYVEILNGTVNYGTINAGQARSGNGMFRVKISTDAPEVNRNEWNAPCFYLTMSKDGTGMIDVDTFKVDLKHYKFRIAHLSLSSNSLLKPGGYLEMDLNVDNLGDTTPLALSWDITPQDPSKATIKMVTSSTCVCNLTEDYIPGGSLTFDVRLYIGNMLQDSVRWDVTEQAIWRR